jgi:hypothetical protein
MMEEEKGSHCGNDRSKRRMRPKSKRMRRKRPYCLGISGRLGTWNNGKRWEV